MTTSELALTKRALTAEKTAQQYLVALAQKDAENAKLRTLLAQVQADKAGAEVARIDAELKALGAPVATKKK